MSAKNQTKSELFKLKFHPTYGFIPNIDKGCEPGSIDKEEKHYLRDLAEKVAQIASETAYTKKRDMWFAHNMLKKERPLVLVFPEDSWFQMIDLDTLKVKDSYWRQWEWYFKHLIYRHERLDDDFVIEPEIYVGSVVHKGDWGVDIKYKKIAENGSYIWEPPLKEERDIEKLKYPSIRVDEAATARIYDTVNEMFGDILPVRMQCGVRIDASIIPTAATLRGMEQLMIDIYDRPQWLHKLLGFITEGNLKMIDYLESNGYLTLNNRNQYTDSGGIGYTRELPKSDFDEKNVRLKDLWVHSASQEYAEVSPAHHEEFGLDYQSRILERYGLVAYGCCESYTRKFAMAKKIPNLRRVSVSPWCDVQTAANELEDKYIYSWKANPAYLAGGFNEDIIRSNVRKTLEATKGCVLEIILKDTFTVENHPERIEIWLKTVREEISRVYG